MIQVLKLILLMLLMGSGSLNSSAKYGNCKADSPNNADNDFQKNFTGTINGKLNVVFHIENKGSEVSGFYYYVSKGIDIKLTGTMNGQKLELYELDHSNNKTAGLIGELKNSVFTGIWQSLASNKSFPVSLKETKSKVIPLPTNIGGNYKTQANDSTDSSPCEVAIKITKNKDAYFYELKTKSHNYKGNVTFNRDMDANELYITLKGIKWSEYSGDKSNPNKKVKTEKPKDTIADVEGVYSENEITIQNDGNAMNSYNVLGECDRKYIRLVKE